MKTMIEQKIDVMVHNLPLYLKKEVLDYVEYLLNKYSKQQKAAAPEKNFRFDWEGGLVDIKDKRTKKGPGRKRPKKGTRPKAPH
ncbi:MAG TPA: DUF2281 domain-containing protein [Candidatus Kapabacteria bacterium]|nr:DUF2281 domain-containing protein [Candidatus Kapabacteria bacterium]